MIKTFLTAFTLGLFTTFPVNAISLNWSFIPTSGPFGSPSDPYIVSGTLDGLSLGSNSGSGITARVTDTPNGALEGTVFNIFESTSLGGDAFTLDPSGNVIFADATYRNSGEDILLFRGFGNSTFIPLLRDSSMSTQWADQTGVTIFTTASPVPVPYDFSIGLGVSAYIGLWTAKKIRKNLSKRTEKKL